VHDRLPAQDVDAVLVADVVARRGHGRIDARRRAAGRVVLAARSLGAARHASDGFDGVEPPLARDALQGLLPTFPEGDVGPRDQILDGAGDENFAVLGGGRDA